MERVGIERPVRSLKTKNLQTPAIENEGIHVPPENRSSGLASSFSLSEKWPETSHKADARDRTSISHADILTLGLRTALPPSQSQLMRPVALGDCHPIQWRNRPRFTRGSQHEKWLD